MASTVDETTSRGPMPARRTSSSESGFRVYTARNWQLESRNRIRKWFAELFSIS